MTLKPIKSYNVLFIILVETMKTYCKFSLKLLKTNVFDVHCELKTDYFISTYRF